MPETERILGDYGARLTNLERDNERIEAKLDKILETLSEAKGGWRVLMLVAGIAGTLGGFIVKYAPYLSGK